MITEEKIEEAKKELQAYRADIKYIEGKTNDSKELKDLVENIVKPLRKDCVRSQGPNLDKAPLEEAFDRINEIEKDCVKKLEELLVNKYLVEDKIERLEQPYKSALYLRYQRGMNVARVADELNYSKSHTDVILAEALKKYVEL